ncbi:hypothetical protein ABFS83_05G092000 [Erythranthe nasuta]
MYIFWYIKSSLVKTPPLPPGPRGLPILGYIPFLGNNLLHQFTDLGHKHGPIFKFYLGKKLCIVISSPSLVKEVVCTQDGVFANRDTPVAVLITTYGGNDIAFSQPNSHWRAMRKIFVQEMMSSKCLEASYNLRREEVRKAIRQLHTKNIGKPVEIGRLTFQTQLNVIMKMVWGGTVEGEQGERIGSEFWALISKIINLVGKPNISDFFPVLARFDIQGLKKEMEGYMKSVDRIYEDVISEYKKKLSREIIKKEGKKDFLHILLEHQEKEDSEYSVSHTQIKAIFMDILAGGTDTTSMTIEWAMAELMNNPEVMIKAQNELSDVVGLNNMIEESHTPKLKYVEAIMKETMRLHPAVPLLVPRSPVQSSTVGGYTIPENSKIFINVWSIQRDPSIWDNPLEFRPERFLDDDDENNEKRF